MVKDHVQLDKGVEKYLDQILFDCVQTKHTASCLYSSYVLCIYNGNVC